MNAKELLDELQKYTSCDTIHLYIIDRKIRDGASKTDKPSEKFEYIPLQVNLGNELTPLVQGMLSGTIEKKVKEDVEIKSYEVIDDTLYKIQTYTDLGKIEGFQNFLNERLNGEIKSITTNEQFREIDKAWAICYAFYSETKESWLYCIKKLRGGKMAIGRENYETVAEAAKGTISSWFDVNTKSLKPFSGVSINIEPSIDMIYVNNAIYIFAKKAFEDITSLTEEFESLAVDLVNEVDTIDFIDGITYVHDVVVKKPSFRNKLIKAKQIGNLELVRKSKNVKKDFNKAGKKLDIKFNFDSDGKIIATNDEEAMNIIRVLSEYYKEGVFGGKVFETAAGRLKK